MTDEEAALAPVNSTYLLQMDGGYSLPSYDLYTHRSAWRPYSSACLQGPAVFWVGGLVALQSRSGPPPAQQRLHLVARTGACDSTAAFW